MARCEDCIHYDVCGMWSKDSGLARINANGCCYFRRAADVAPRSEWISVEERLPEPNEECLVSARVGDRVVIDLGEIVRYWNGHTNEYGFMWMITNDWDEGEGCKITHWMPLPEPPKGD